MKRSSGLDVNEVSQTGGSRRSFLKRVPLVLAGGLLIGGLAGKATASRLRRRRLPSFPDGSIFTPAREQGRDI